MYLLCKQFCALLVLSAQSLTNDLLFFLTAVVYDVSWAAELLHGTDHGNQRSDLASHFSALPTLQEENLFTHAHQRARAVDVLPLTLLLCYHSLSSVYSFQKAWQSAQAEVSVSSLLVQTDYRLLHQILCFLYNPDMKFQQRMRTLIKEKQPPRAAILGMSPLRQGEVSDFPKATK